MANDWTWGPQTDASLTLEGVPGSLRALLRQSHIYMFLEKIAFGDQVSVEDDSTPPSTSGPRVPPHDFAENFEAMRAMCQQYNAAFVIMCLPLAPVLERRSQPYREIETRMARSPDVTFLDIYSEWKANGLNTRMFSGHDPVHPLPGGHELISRDLGRCVYTLLNRPPSH